MESRPWVSSGILNSSAAVLAGEGRVKSVVVLTDGTNAGTVIIYDNPTAASGTVLAKFVTAGADLTGGAVNLNILARTGIYASISGTGCTAIVHYQSGSTI